MSNVALLAPQVTVHRGKVWFRDDENVCYSVDMETARDIAIHSRLVTPSTVDPRTFYVSFSAIRVRRESTGSVELPLCLPSHGPRATRVDYAWLMLIAPMLHEALRIHAQSPNDSFTLVLNTHNEIEFTNCDRRSIVPRPEEEE